MEGNYDIYEFYDNYLINSLNSFKLLILLKSTSLIANFFNAPASKYNHHDYKGGLLEHTVQTVEFALAIYENSNNQIDKDLVIAGAALHDIGKIHCYEQNGNFIDITDTFLTQEQIVNGIKIVSKEITSEKLDDLIHIIASHHNLKEWGSPVSPMSNEA